MEPDVPLPKDIQDLLDAERGLPPVPSGIEAKLWASIAPQAPAQLPSPSGVAGGVKATGVLTSMKLPLAVAFILGGAVGAALHAAWQQPREVVRIVPAPAPTAETPSSPPPTPAPPAQPPVVTTVEPPVVHKRPAPIAPPATKAMEAPTAPAPVAKPEETSTLGAEQALLEMGRTALARGAYDAAYQAMVEHERRFPGGQLSEERDAVRIQALAGLGQLDAAKLMAQSFRAQFPHSLLLPAVERALATGPGGHP